MAFQESTGWCKRCKAQVLTRREKVGCVVGFLASMLTLGLALPFVILYQAGVGGWRCIVCGRKV